MASPKRRAGYAAFAVLAFLVLLVAGGLFRPGFPDEESTIREVMARHLVEGRSTGRQGLVGSIWWAPLPTLLRTPLALVFGGPQGIALSSWLFGAVAGAACLTFLYTMSRRWAPGTPALVVILALGAHPLFLEAVADGGRHLVAAFWLIVTGYGFLTWIEHRRLRGLAYFGLGGALLVLSSFPLALWFLLMLGYVFLYEIFQGSNRAQLESVLLLAAVPVAYALALWVLLNWLVMGAAGFFLRPLAGPAPEGGLLSLHLDLATAGYYAFLIAFVPGGILLFRKPRGAPLALILAALGVIVVALALVLVRRLVVGSDVLFAWWGLAAVGLLFALRLRIMERPARPSGGWIMATALLVTLFGWFWLPARDAGLKLGGPDAVRRLDLQDSGLYRFVLDSDPWPKVLVTGYSGFDLLHADPQPRFAVNLDFDLDEIIKVYGGHRLFVLVPRPVGMRGLDRALGDGPALYRHGHPAFMYVSDWDDWRLYEIIQPPRGKAS